ncbi:helix-turn-helix domain-containing protein [Spiroplasma endosymbiont of Tipula paludosa]|uniref:helix-turn-helix domain-containing protein n=1 Tax=Spiroplasma endosymbiont of Tipula paludosa TaxID=3066295 RepID=UPI0035C8F3D9
MGYKHLGIDERIYIENQLKFKVKISEIAKNLNRSISTINREVNRNKDNNHYFSLDLVHNYNILCRLNYKIHFYLCIYLTFVFHLKNNYQNSR